MGRRRSKSKNDACLLGSSGSVQGSMLGSKPVGIIAPSIRTVGYCSSDSSDPGHVFLRLLWEESESRLW